MSTPTREPITVVIAEKSPILSHGLAGLFAADSRFAPPCMTADGESFLAALDGHSYAIGIIGWEMPRIDGQTVLRTLRGRPGSPRMIVYTGRFHPELPRQVMMLGAAGFCSKSEPPQQLLATALTVAAGRMAFPHIDVSQTPADPLGELTWQEQELLARLSDGLTNQQIASRLALSLNTVKFHLRTLYDKLAIRNRAQAVAFYLRECRNR
ncbi:MAG: response regulator transcription factor [Magnetospirillum sp.]|nr:response regulator transcription factor [Magnetospirillum sp.]